MISSANKKVDLAHVAELVAKESGLSRKVYPVEEHGFVDVPLIDLLIDDRLDLYPEISRGDFLRATLSKGALKFQATGKVGHIPINSKVALSVSPRVPVSNLERILRVSDYPPEILTAYSRNYATHQESSNHLLDALVNGFLDSVEEVIRNGIRKSYEREELQTSFPRGRINFSQSLSLRATNRRHLLAVSIFDYHTNHPINHCLKFTLWYIGMFYAGQKMGAGRASIRVRVNKLYRMFGPIALDSQMAFLAHPSVQDTSRLDDTRRYYAASLNLAKVILQSKGVSFTTVGTEFSMACMFIDLAEVFERYLLNVLRSGLDESRLLALNGNKADEFGARRRFFDPEVEGLVKTEATPDIVLSVPGGKSKLDSVEAVLEVKYKPIDRAPSKEDVNQAISYALCYRTSKVVLVHPRMDSRAKGLQLLGRISQVYVYSYSYDLNASDLEKEEQTLCFWMTGLPQPNT